MLSPKQHVQRLLRRVGLYNRIRFSCWYDLYWRVFDRRLIDNRSKEIEFFRNTLKIQEPGSLIFDIGANRGYKTDIFLRLGARVIAVDPDPLNHKILRESFQTFRIRKESVVIVAKAVSDGNGVGTLWVDEPGSGKNTLNVKWAETLRDDSTRFGQSLKFHQKIEVETTTVEDLIRIYGRPTYIKIDVEGHETSVIAGMRTPVPYLSFEANLPEFAPETARCIDLLEKITPHAEFNYTSNCGQGMALERWVSGTGLQSAVSCCREPSIEIFCRTPSS